MQTTRSPKASTSEPSAYAEPASGAREAGPSARRPEASGGSNGEYAPAQQSQSVAVHVPAPARGQYTRPYRSSSPAMSLPCNPPYWWALSLMRFHVAPTSSERKKPYWPPTDPMM